MSEFSTDDLRSLNAAQGWLELGNHREADAELENISPKMRSHPDVLEVRWEVYAWEKKWEACVDIALSIMRADPDRSQGWLHHSYALHELGRTEAAYTHLATVAEKFKDLWTVPYNLACYCAQLGRLDDSREWFKKALILNTEIVRAAGIDDPDLQPLWDSMSGTMWTRE